MRRRGFTIVELLMVVGIISVLITISATAIKGSITNARKQRADALCTIVEQGLAAYYAQENVWPITTLENKETDTNKDYYTLNDNEVRQMVVAIVKKTADNNPLIDVAGLFVARKDASKYGMDFMDAIHGSKQQREKLRLSQLIFGYPDPSTGHFKVFKMRYYPASDTVKVTQS